MRKNLDDPITDNVTLDKTFVEKDSKTEKKTKGKGRGKELSDEEKRKLEEENSKIKEEERARKLKEEENVKRLDEPLPKTLEDEEKEIYSSKLLEIQEIFTEITLRQMNLKYEHKEGEGEDAPQEVQPDEETKADQKAEGNQDTKPIEEAEEAEKPETEGENDNDDGEGKGEGQPLYFGARILHEVPMQYNFRYL